MAFAGLLYSVTVEMTTGDPVLCKKVLLQDVFITHLPHDHNNRAKAVLCLSVGYLAKLGMTSQGPGISDLASS